MTWHEEPYRDRRHAGAELARRLGHIQGRHDVVVLALPRGGVPVASEVARALDAPEAAGDEDLDDPVPVVRLLNRQRAALALDPEEAFEVLAALESVIIGDVDACRVMLARYAALGVDRLMCLMSFGALPQERVLRSLRLTGEHLL